MEGKTNMRRAGTKNTEIKLKGLYSIMATCNKKPIGFNHKGLHQDTKG